MRGWGGLGSIDFEVERKIVDGNLVPLEDSDESTIEYQVINLRINGSVSFMPGNKYGPMDSCFPDESEQEIRSVVQIHEDSREEPLKIDFLTEDEQDLVLDRLVEQVCESCGDDYDPPDPDDFD